MTAMYDSFINYLKASYQELGRVLWPSWQDTLRLTLIVVGVSLFVAIVLGAFDAAFQYIISRVVILK